MRNNLKIERAVKDLTQEELAKRVGVSRQTISAIEKGNYVPSTVLSLKIAAIFEKNLEDIFKLEEIDWVS